MKRVNALTLALLFCSVWVMPVYASGSGADYPLQVVSGNEQSETHVGTSENYMVLNNPIFSGTVRHGATPVQGGVVALTLPWTSSAHPWVRLNATTDSEGRYSFDNLLLAGYNEFLTLEMFTWQNNGTVYYPQYPGASIPSEPQIFDFNTQQQAVVLQFIHPLNHSTVLIAPGDPVHITATAEMLTENDDTVTSVLFTINGQDYTALKGTDNTYVYSWTPPDDLFSSTIQVTALAWASNGMTATEAVSFFLDCQGEYCPNKPPVLSWILPVNTVINQASGFQPVTILVYAADPDGVLATVSISIDGVPYSMLPGAEPDTYTHTFTPAAYREYPVNVTATDDAGATTSLGKTLIISGSGLVPLPPGPVILGYKHSWSSSETPYVYYNQLVDKKFNAVAYAFIQTVNNDGYTPYLFIDESLYRNNGVYDPQLLKDDINALRNHGVPVIVSIGGANAFIQLATVEQKNIFVAGVKAIIDEYGFDGVDIDFEGNSMDFGAGALRDFSYQGISAYPKLRNVVDAFKELKQHYGEGFILTAAPETYYVQRGYKQYDNRAGSFLPVIHNLRDELDLLMVQLYNTGSMYALDDQIYYQSTPDFITSMTDMVIKGFNVANTGVFFQGLPASKICVALPACPHAGPAGGYLQPSETTSALDYLRFGTHFPGRQYTLRPGGPYPDLRGMMTWSVEWDAKPDCASAYEFSNAYHEYFFSGLSQPGPISGNQTPCQGVGYTYSVDPVTGATSYTWSFSGEGTPAGNGTSCTLDPGSDGVLSVVANNNEGFSTPRTLGLTIINSPGDPGPVTGNTSPEKPSSGNVYAVSGVTQVSYYWEYSGNGAPITAGQGSSSITVSYLEDAEPGTWTVTPANDCGTGPSSSIDITFVILTGHIITASAGPNGSISPHGEVSVKQGNDQTFSISPAPGYVIADVLVDGNSTGAASAYTFLNVTGPHTIHAVFAADPCTVAGLPYTATFDGPGIPACWISSSLAGALHWQTGSFSGGLARSGSYIYVNAAENTAQAAGLTSPAFDFSRYDDISIEFVHYYRHFRSTATLSYSLNGGVNWVSVQSWNATTSNPSVYIRNIPAVAGQPNVIFRWHFGFDGGGSPSSQKSWSVDDVKITGTIAGATYTITSSAGTGGSINPSGNVTVAGGNNQSFTITSNTGYQIADVLVDNVSIGPESNYTFTNVQSDHTILATFEIEPADPCLVTFLPYSSDFNASSLPDCWSNMTNTGNTAWQAGTFSGGLSGTTGNYAYFLHQGNQEQNADLISPSFDFSGYENISISFTHRYLHDRSTARLYYSTDGGSSWTMIQEWSANTANPASFSHNLDGLSGQGNVRFRWNLHFTGGGSPRGSRSWSLDDVVISATMKQQALTESHAAQPLAGTPEDHKLKVIAYPNPTTGKLLLQFKQDVGRGVLYVTDIQGRRLKTMPITDVYAGSSLEIRLDGFARGLYLLQVVTDNSLFNSIISKE